MLERQERDLYAAPQNRKTLSTSQYTGRHLWPIATILMLTLGSLLMFRYFYPASSQLSAPTVNFGVGVTRGVSLNWPITLDLYTQKAEPELDIQALLHPIPQTPSQEEPAYLMFLLPFHVDHVISSGVSKGTLDNWNYVNEDDGVGSLIYAQVSNDSVNFNATVAYANLTVAETFESSLRGAYIIVLPLGQNVQSQFGNTLQEKLGVQLLPVNLIDVYVTLKSSPPDVQSFPQLTQRPQLNVVWWRLNQVQTLTLNYEDSTQIAEFNVILIVGSLCLGTVPSSIIDLCKKRDEAKTKTPSTRKDSCG